MLTSSGNTPFSRRFLTSDDYQLSRLAYCGTIPEDGPSGPLLANQMMRSTMEQKMSFNINLGQNKMKPKLTAHQLAKSNLVSMKSHSLPPRGTNTLSDDINLICTSVKQKAIIARQNLLNLTTENRLGNSIKKAKLKFLNFMRFSPNAMTCDTEVVLQAVHHLIISCQEIENTATETCRNAIVGDPTEKENMINAQVMTRRVKYILADLYNNLVTLEVCMGRKSFKVFNTTFKYRMKNKKIENAIKRSLQKYQLDIRMDIKHSELLHKEQIARHSELKSISGSKLSFMQEWVKLNKVKKDISDFNKEKVEVCRICMDKIERENVQKHSGVCKKIQDVMKQLQETNNWLLRQCKKAIKLKANLGYDSISGKKSSKHGSKKKKGQSSNKGSPASKQNNKQLAKDGLKASNGDKAKRAAFRTKKCPTNYKSQVAGDEDEFDIFSSGKNTSKEKQKSQEELEKIKQEEIKKKESQEATTSGPFMNQNKPKKSSFAKKHQQNRAKQNTSPDNSSTEQPSPKSSPGVSSFSQKSDQLDQKQQNEEEADEEDSTQNLPPQVLSHPSFKKPPGPSRFRQQARRRQSNANLPEPELVESQSPELNDCTASAVEAPVIEHKQENSEPFNPDSFMSDFDDAEDNNAPFQSFLTGKIVAPSNPIITVSQVEPETDKLKALKEGDLPKEPDFNKNESFTLMGARKSELMEPSTNLDSLFSDDDEEEEDEEEHEVQTLERVEEEALVAPTIRDAQPARSLIQNIQPARNLIQMAAEVLSITQKEDNETDDVESLITDKNVYKNSNTTDQRRSSVVEDTINCSIDMAGSRRQIQDRSIQGDLKDKNSRSQSRRRDSSDNLKGGVKQLLLQGSKSQILDESPERKEELFKGKEKEKVKEKEITKNKEKEKDKKISKQSTNSSIQNSRGLSNPASKNDSIKTQKTQPAKKVDQKTQAMRLKFQKKSKGKGSATAYVKPNAKVKQNVVFEVPSKEQSNQIENQLKSVKNAKRFYDTIIQQVRERTACSNSQIQVTAHGKSGGQQYPP